ncbi:Gp49 family protein [Neobacillus sp. NRS-1170]|uniref:Gp49 family protein n=1 Tax=Neobacillus sp. NRS-1170 TaxID=3233898 RepID=UPI003D2AC5A1
MKVFQVKGIPGNKVELLEMTPDGKVKVRNLISNDIIETTQQAFDMAFEPSDYAFFAVKDQQITQKATKTEIDAMIEKSQIEITQLFGKCTIVAVLLPNGFVMTESCVSPDKELNKQYCLERIKNKILELEAYKFKSLTTE